MIGIIADEGATYFEFSPVFAKRCWFDFHLKLPNFTTDSQSREWGFAFSGWNTIWVMTGVYTRNYSLPARRAK